MSSRSSRHAADVPQGRSVVLRWLLLALVVAGVVVLLYAAGLVVLETAEQMLPQVGGA